MTTRQTSPTKPAIRLATLCLDCHDAHAMARFYGGLLGWETAFSEDDWALVPNPDGGIGLSFQADEAYVRPVWPESEEEQQKMMHLDVRVDDLETSLDVALAYGGMLAEHQPRTDLHVVLDPAGHPLCLFLDHV